MELSPSAWAGLLGLSPSAWAGLLGASPSAWAGLLGASPSAWAGVFALLKTAICHLYHIMAFFPSADHIASLFYAHTLLSSHSLRILQREHVRQHFQEVSGATLTDSLFTSVGFLDVFAEEFHLAPEVVVQTPVQRMKSSMLFSHFLPFAT